MTGEDLKVKDIMSPIEEYDTMDLDEPLCNALSILRENYKKIESNVPGNYHKTLFVTDASKKIVGKLSVYDLIRGLVPEGEKKPVHSSAYYTVISSRARDVSNQVGKIQERYQWLHTTFLDLVRQETQKKIKEVMSPIHPLLAEDDPINKAIYVMFRENIRQPLVLRNEAIVGVVSIMDIFPELLRVAGHECFLSQG
jgi:CBS domain-containing protein